MRDGVRDDHLLNDLSHDTVLGWSAQDRMGSCRPNTQRAVRLDRLGGVTERPSRIDHIIDQQRMAALDVPDEVHHLSLIHI